MAVDSAGKIYIADTGNVSLRKVTPDGIIATIAGGFAGGGFSGDGGPATQAKLLYPQSVAVDRSGNLYIAEWGNNRIRKVDTNGVINTIAGNGQAGSVGFRRTLGMVAGKSPTEIGIRPQSVAVDRGGNVFIADPDDSCVWMLTPDERIRAIAGDPQSNTLGDGGPATKAMLNPVGLALGKNGTIYVADAFHGRIRMLTPNRPPLEITTLDESPVGALPPTAAASPTVTAPVPSDRSLSVDQLASRVADAIASNDRQYKNLLYNWELSAEFTGRPASPFPTFGDTGERVHSRMPAFHGHIQLMDNKPVSIQDGWEDRPPYREKDLRRRTILPAAG